MHRVTLRIGDDTKRQLDLLAAKDATTPAALARRLVERGVMEEAERSWAPLVRNAMREELDAFLSSSRMDREFAFDDMYGSLANELRADLDAVRVLTGASLGLLLGESGCSDDALGEAFDAGAEIGFAKAAQHAPAFDYDEPSEDEDAWL